MARLCRYLVIDCALPCAKSTRLRDNWFLLHRPPCVRAATPQHRTLVAGYAALPQWLYGNYSCLFSSPSLAIAHNYEKINQRCLSATNRLRFALLGGQRENFLLLTPPRLLMGGLPIHRHYSRHRIFGTLLWLAIYYDVLSVDRPDLCRIDSSNFLLTHSPPNH